MMDEEGYKTLMAAIAMHAILNRVVNIEATVLAEDAYAVANAMFEARQGVDSKEVV